MSDSFLQFMKHGSDVEIIPWSADAMETHILATSEGVASGFLDEVSVADGLVHMRGWEFIPEMESKEQSVYVELTDSSGDSTQYPAKMMTRSDVANGFNDQRYAQSEYMTVFPADDFKNNTYSVRVLWKTAGRFGAPSIIP